MYAGPPLGEEEEKCCEQEKAVPDHTHVFVNERDFSPVVVSVFIIFGLHAD